MKKLFYYFFLSILILQAAPPASYQNCIECHGSKADQNSMVMGNKGIPNQLSKTAFYQSLKAYAQGTQNRYGKGAMMRGAALKLSDIQMRSIADYFGK